MKNECCSLIYCFLLLFIIFKGSYCQVAGVGYDILPGLEHHHGWLVFIYYHMLTAPLKGQALLLMLRIG